ncbi:hypothetical protein PGB90_007903 [Kerria lacca]
MEEKNEVKNTCGLCGASAENKCSACRQINYCSKEHQKNHWKSHKLNCKPFIIQKNAKKGRYIVASRNIKINEILIKEDAIIIGPKLISPESVCLGCFKPIVSVFTSPKCTKCGWPICHLQCSGIGNEHKIECEILAAENEKERKIYREIQELYLYLKDNILKKINYDEVITEEAFHRVCGILDVNGLDVPFGSTELLALYPTFVLIEHSCLPNTKISFNKSQITIKSARAINTNENISTMYTNLLWGTQMRQQHLLNTKYFTCSCCRCEDPTELGTHFSSIQCLQDNCYGYLIPKITLVVDSAWQCTNCSTVMSSSDVDEIVSTVTFEVDQMLEQKYPNVKKVETLLQKLLSILHPCHYNCFSVKHSLIQLYGNQMGYPYSSLNDELLNKKTEYCQELISVLSKLDSTGSRVPLYIAITKYELSAAILEISRRIFFETLNLSLIQEKGKEAKKLLTESVILLKEEKNSITCFQLIRSCKNLYKEIDDILTGKYFPDF